jgi:hypothetical protein
MSEFKETANQIGMVTSPKCVCVCGSRNWSAVGWQRRGVPWRISYEDVTELITEEDVSEEDVENRESCNLVSGNPYTVVTSKKRQKKLLGESTSI